MASLFRHIILFLLKHLHAPAEINQYKIKLNIINLPWSFLPATNPSILTNTSLYEELSPEPKTHP